MRSNRRIKGYQAETIARLFLEKKGYLCLGQNYTIRGGELDLIMRSGEAIVFVEVKSVDAIDDYLEYISETKHRSLRHTIQHYCQLHQVKTPIRLDIILVKNKNIVEHMINCTI